MAEFILMLAVVVICVLLFGKADSKRKILQQVGLDLSESNYESKKNQKNHHTNRMTGLFDSMVTLQDRSLNK